MKKSMIITILATIFMIGCQQETEDSNDTISGGEPVPGELVELVNNSEGYPFCYQGNYYNPGLEYALVDESLYPTLTYYICPEADCITADLFSNGEFVRTDVICESDIPTNYTYEIVEQ